MRWSRRHRLGARLKIGRVFSFRSCPESHVARLRSHNREAWPQGPLRECYPDRKEGYFPVAGGQLFRFVHEVKTGDYAVYPSKQDRNVRIGEIVGPYEFDPKERARLSATPTN
jgi:predicted Mrr-cat superfamily restriction endonuclease